MLFRTDKGQELVNTVQKYGVEEVGNELLEGLGTDGHRKPADFSIRDLFEAFVTTSDGKPVGSEVLGRMTRGMRGEQLALLEASGVVSTSAFANITGQIVYNKVNEGYKLPTFIRDDLCETVGTEFLDGEKIPGVGGLGDKALVVSETDGFQYVGMNEEWSITPATEKRGFIVPISREAIMADRTGLILKAAKKAGEWMGVNKEKRVLDLFFGITNNYNRNGTSYNTYLTSGAWINNQVNALVDWTSIQTAEITFEAVTDPNTGEPSAAGGVTHLILPTGLKWTGMRIAHATEIQHVDNTASPTTIRTTSTNPLNERTYKILSNTYVKLRSGSSTTWFAASNPKDAVYYMQNWGIETTQAASNSEKEFENDIVSRTKVSERGTAFMIQPRLLQKNTAS